MVKRSGTAPNEEPEQSDFEKPSEKEHLFQVADIYDESKKPEKMTLDANTVCAKIEVVGGDEEGRTILNRTTLDFNGKGFWATRLFLKAIGEPHKGKMDIDTDNWQGKQFYATVKHDGKYANIDKFNFEKMIEKVDTKPDTAKPVDSDAVAWDE